VEPDTQSTVIFLFLNKMAPIPETYMVDIEMTPSSLEWGSAASEPAAEGDIQMENSSD
jgi:hypothetical protein